MRRYETIVIFHPGKGDSFVRESVERFRGQITALGGGDFCVQEWGTRDLMYPIRKQTRGIYVHLQYESDSDCVRELNRTLKISDDVLRYATLVAPRVQPKLRTAVGIESNVSCGSDQYDEEVRA